MANANAPGSAAPYRSRDGAAPEAPEFSDLWFRTFLDTIAPAATAAEVAFLERVLPIAEHPRVLDVCCGAGRHAVPLAQRGFDVTGVDREAAVLQRAREQSARLPRRAREQSVPSIVPPTFIQADVRALPVFEEPFDAAIIMWASFGYFEPAENESLLVELRRRLRSRGRIVLDIYNRDFFATRLGTRRSARAGLIITEHKLLRNGRLCVELRYDGHDTIDRFSWQVFDPTELAAVIDAAGFDTLVLCREFDEKLAPSADHARMQIVGEARVR